MLKLGEQNISDLYLGGEQIKKAYLGETLVFSARKLSRLPEGYTELEYIKSTGTQCIDTGIKPSDAMRIEVDIMPTKSATSTAVSIFGSVYTVSSSSPSYYKRFQFTWSSKGFQAACGNTLSTVSSDVSIRQVSIGINAPEMSAHVNKDSVSLTEYAYTFSKNPNIYLLANKSGANAPKSFFYAQLYSCKIYEDESLVRNFVPCTNPSGVVGLYDLVGNQFYANAGTGTFTAGPAV